MIEIHPMSMATNVKISSISEDVYVQTFGKTSVIDWQITTFNMYIEKELIINDKPNKNNRRYPIEVLQKMRDQINSKDRWQNLGILGHPESNVIRLGQVAFNYSNAVIEDNALYCDIEVIDIHRGAELKQILEYEKDGHKRIVFRPIGEGSFNGEVPEEVHNLLEISVVDRYDLLMISAFPITEDAVNL
jgi:hypothetical protein